MVTCVPRTSSWIRAEPGRSWALTSVSHLVTRLMLRLGTGITVYKVPEIIVCYLLLSMSCCPDFYPSWNFVSYCVFLPFSPSMCVKSGTPIYRLSASRTQNMLLLSTSYPSAVTCPLTCTHWACWSTPCLMKASPSFRSTSRTYSRASADNWTRWGAKTFCTPLELTSCFKACYLPILS